jgi:hypothetical protein
MGAAHALSGGGHEPACGGGRGADVPVGDAVTVVEDRQRQLSAALPAGGGEQDEDDEEREAHTSSVRAPNGGR